MVGHLDEVGIYWDWNQMHISMYWNLLYVWSGLTFGPCVHLEFGLRCSRWVIFMVVYTLTNNLFSWWCSLTKYYILYVFVILSRNQFHEGDSHEIHFMTVTHGIPNSHEIGLWRWPLMKYHKKPSWNHRCKPGDNVIFMRVAATKFPSWK